MGRKCTICTHPHRAQIEAALVENHASQEQLAGEFGVSQAAISRHVNAGHMSRADLSQTTLGLIADDVHADEMRRRTQATIVDKIRGPELLLSRVEKIHSELDDMEFVAKTHADTDLRLAVTGQRIRMFGIESGFVLQVFGKSTEDERNVQVEIEEI